MSKKLRGMLVLILLISSSSCSSDCDCSSRRSSHCDCSSRGLTSVPQDLPTTITELDLRYNSITTLDHNDILRYRSLTKLNLGGNQLASLPTNIFLGLDNLQYLYLYNNSLTTLPSDIFEGLGNLRHIQMQVNRQLTNLPPDIFEGLTNLDYLHMSSNRLPSLPPDIFQGLGKLENLELGGGVLTSLPAGIFAGLGSLVYLSLNTNDLTSLPADLFAGLDNLRHLSLHGNQLTHLSAEIFPVLASISSVNIRNNPWQCDCEMAPFKQRMTGSYSFEQQITCAGPGNLQGLSLLQDVRLEDLICEQTTIHSTFSSSYFIVESHSSTSMAPPSTQTPSTTHNGNSPRLPTVTEMPTFHTSTSPSPVISSTTTTKKTESGAGSTSSVFSLTVFLSAFLGVAAGALIVCGGLLAFWCHYRRMKRNHPSVPDSNNVVFSTSNNAASVTVNGQGQAGQHYLGTELSEEYEDVCSPSSISQPAVGHSQNRREPPNPPPSSGDRAAPQAADNNGSAAVLPADTGHHYQSLRWA